MTFSFPDRPGASRWGPGREAVRRPANGAWVDFGIRSPTCHDVPPGFCRTQETRLPARLRRLPHHPKVVPFARAGLVPIARSLTFDAESGMYHYRARAYDPEAGRFLQRDPLGYVDRLGLFEYVRTSPAVHRDPLGETPEEGGNGESPKPKKKAAPPSRGEAKKKEQDGMSKEKRNAAQTDVARKADLPKKIGKLPHKVGGTLKHVLGAKNWYDNRPKSTWDADKLKKIAALIEEAMKNGKKVEEKDKKGNKTGKVTYEYDTGGRVGEKHDGTPQNGLKVHQGPKGDVHAHPFTPKADTPKRPPPPKKSPPQQPPTEK